MKPSERIQQVMLINDNDFEIIRRLFLEIGLILDELSEKINNQSNIKNDFL